MASGGNPKVSRSAGILWHKKWSHGRDLMSDVGKVSGTFLRPAKALTAQGL